MNWPNLKTKVFFALFYATGASAPAAEGFVPNLGPDLPRITVRCGDLTLLLRQSSQWTPGRIDFRGNPLSTERSAYGTVFSFPGCGFVGTNHLENEPEELTALSFFLDGKQVDAPAAEWKGSAFRFERESRIRSFRLRCEIELRDNRLFETTAIAADRDTPLTLVYHFMHAWTPTVSAYLAGRDDAPGEVMGGSLEDREEVARAFFVQRRVDWVAVCEPKNRSFAVSRLLAAPEKGGHVSMIWNVPGTYRKYYLKCFQGETVPAGFSGTWRMVTAFGSCSGLEAWEADARRVAGELRQLK